MTLEWHSVVEKRAADYLWRPFVAAKRQAVVEKQLFEHLWLRVVASAPRLPSGLVAHVVSTRKQSVYNNVKIKENKNKKIRE